MKRIVLVLCLAAGMGACGDGGDTATRTDSTTNDKPGSMYRDDSTIQNDTSQREPNPTQPRDTSARH